MSLDYATLEALQQEFGPSFYIYHRPSLERNFEAFRNAFQAVYRKSIVAYSYKTNYLPEICRDVDRLGGYAEVVSIMEYELAARLGVPAQRIIFNGPYKQRSHLRRALEEGATVNLDAGYEVAMLEELAALTPQLPLGVGLRCNLSHSTGIASRFGVDLSGDELERLAERIRSIPGARLLGLHCHQMPPQRSTGEYRHITQAMLGAARRLFPDAPPAFLDLGGGFFSREIPAFHAQFGLPVPTPLDYAEAIARPFAEAFPSQDGPHLVVEPGMALVADALRFVTRVVDIKAVGSRRLALVAASVYNVLPNKPKRNLPLVRVGPADASSTSSTSTDVVGYTCMEDDLLYRGFEGELAAGDFLVFDNVGAYSIVLEPPFILPAPAVIALEGRPRVLRRAQCFDDVFSGYVFPPAEARR